MLKKSIICLSLILFSSQSFAHTGLLESVGFWEGLIHPFLGIDHLLVMIALGLWAATQSFKQAKLMLLTFLCSMLVGATLSISGIYFAHVELMILVSVCLMGLLLTTSTVNISKVLALVFIATVALLHGQAHGAELPATASALMYSGGFMLATSLLLLSGLVLGHLFKARGYYPALRVYGSLTSVAGVYLLFAS